MSKRAMTGILIASAVFVAFLFWAGVTVASYVANPAVQTIRSQITLPGTLDGSRVVVGDAFDFILGNNAAAKIKLTPGNADRLLASNNIFSDCTDSGRQCGSKAWAAPTILLSFYGVEMPKNPRCVESYASGSHARHDSHVICVDRETSELYYFSWDTDSR